MAKVYNFNAKKKAISTCLNKLFIDWLWKKSKYPKMDLEEALENIFDIMKYTGDWLNKEEKHFRLKQIESGGEIGYTTLNEGYIHPSKQKMLTLFWVLCLPPLKLK